MKVKSEREVAQSCPTLSDPMDCSPPGSSIHGIFQARVLEWGAIAFSKLRGEAGKSIQVPYAILELTEILGSSVFGEGNGNPLQCSCLENLRDGGAWWASVCGVTQSQTRLKRLSSSSSSSTFLSGESQGRGSLVGCLLWGRTESDTTDAT